MHKLSLSGAFSLSINKSFRLAKKNFPANPCLYGDSVRVCAIKATRYFRLANGFEFPKMETASSDFFFGE